MESWCFDSLEKGFVSNETIPQSDSTIRNRSVLMAWELKPPLSYENSVLISSQESVENSCFPELGIAEMIRKQFHHDSTKIVLDGNAGVGDMISPSLVTSNAISGDEESSSKISSSVMDTNSRESSLIDLKLGGFGNKPNSDSTRAARVLSSAESSTPSKRARVTSLSSQTAYCQVYGCHKDLSSAKDYHRRHKVCDVHSKTSKVIVNNIEQRFCQQCSRFHLLGEFDDGKRSCRKRLAGHNERRRKPQIGFGGRNGRSFQSYTGSNFQGFSQTSKSFICPDILQRGTSHTENYGTNDWVRYVKVENETECTQKPAYNCINGQLHPKSTLPPSIIEKQWSFVDDTNNTKPQSVFGENVNQYTTPEIVSHSLFQTHSSAARNEEYTLLNAASTVQGLPVISESGCALSLLSSQSWNSSAHSSGMPGDYSLIISSSSPCYPMNVKDRLSCENVPTIDLLQLSSQLHRVENRRQSEPHKQETEGFCCLRMT